MRPLVELEVAALPGPLDTPASEDARHVDHVLLRVAAVHAEGVQLEQLAGVVLVEPQRDALPIIEIEQHRRALGRGDQEILEPAQRVRADHVLDVIGQQEPVGALAEKHRSEEHTSELQSPCNLVCRLLLEKKKTDVYKMRCTLSSITRAETLHGP